MGRPEFNLLSAQENPQNTEKSQENPYWWKPHPLVICQPIFKLPPSEDERELIQFLSTKVIKPFTTAYIQRQAPVLVLGSDSNPNQTENPSSLATILQPVLLPKYPDEMSKILQEIILNSQNKNPFEKGDIIERVKNSFPSINFPQERPYVIQALEIAEMLNIQKGLKTNFLNVILQRDDENLFNQLPSQWQQYILWMYLANFGAFRQIFVPYRIENGEIKAVFYLNTLEGGHPEFSIDTFDTLIQRVMALGSSVELGEWKQLDNVIIPNEIWQNSPDIQVFIDFGKFCGNKDLLSPPVNLTDLIRNPNLARLATKLAGYSKQAEGAFQGYFNFHDLTKILKLPFDMVPFCTISGRFGAVKTNLTFDDFSVIAGFENNTALVIPIEGKKSKGPSIETAELIETDIKLAQENPLKYTVRLKKTDNGFLLDDQGKITGPVVAAKIHLHRGVNLQDGSHQPNGLELSRSGNFIFIPMNTEVDPPAPCGSDLQKHHTEKYMRLAIEEWIKSEKNLDGAIIEMANHGCLVLLFWSKSDPRHPLERLKEAINNREIEFSFPVPQK